MSTRILTETRQTVRTHDHDRIQHWVENRGGRPAVVESTWDGKRGELRIDFGESDESLVEITWVDFFNIFEERQLDFVYLKNSDSITYQFIAREG